MTLIIITKRGRSLTNIFQFTVERHVANNSVAVWAPFSQAWKVFWERHHTTLNCLRNLIFLLLEAIFLAKRVYNLVARASREPRVVLARYKIRWAINKSFFPWIYAWCPPVTSCSVKSWTFRVSRQHKLCRWWLDYEQSLFFLGPSSKTLVTRKWPRVTEGARREISSRASALVSRVSRLRCFTHAGVCNPLIKSEEKERLLAVYWWPAMFTIGESQAMSHSNNTGQQAQQVAGNPWFSTETPLEKTD